MSASRFAGLQPWLEPYANYLLDVAVYNGFKPIVTSVFRSLQQQETLYDRFKRGLSDLPAAPPGKSKHNYGLAFDMVITPGDYRSPAQQAVGRFWESMGGRWGGMVDPVHFEAP